MGTGEPRIEPRALQNEKRNEKHHNQLTYRSRRSPVPPRVLPMMRRHFINRAAFVLLSPLTRVTTAAAGNAAAATYLLFVNVHVIDSEPIDLLCATAVILEESYVHLRNLATFTPVFTTENLSLTSCLGGIRKTQQNTPSVGCQKSRLNGERGFV